ncbi:HP0495 family protein [Cysteiniphilum halobium]|uniref:HP0495 family protein n=1 Tax=Cysteiniphilum halobium TaxID=2219059 RepID=UPI003F857FDE
MSDKENKKDKVLPKETVNPENNEAKQPETFFEFPCRFPIKIMANPQKEIAEFVLNILEKHIENPEAIEFTTRESKTGKYISITAVFEATSKEQLDNIYQALSGHPEIHMVL